MEKEQIRAIRRLYEHVDKVNLTQREQQMLALLNNEQQEMDFHTLGNGIYRIIQFKSNSFLELSTTLKLLLPVLIRVNQEEQLVIEQFSGENLTKSELFDVLKTLSQDTGEHIHAYVGFFVERDDLKSLYFEEKMAFEQGQSYSEMLISKSLKVHSSPMLKKIQYRLKENIEDQHLVKSLYQTSGNQAQAAKLLYVHRNTLLNKIKKFEQKYGLQLMGSDLILAYNLL